MKGKTLKKIIDKDIQQILYEIRENNYSIQTLIYDFLDQISIYNNGETGVNAISQLNPDLIFIAENLDKDLKAKSGSDFPLYGIPVLLKGNIDTADKMQTNAGALALDNNYSKYDAHVVTLLRQAGAIIMGKTNMTELANSVTTKMPSGYSSKGGRVKCPYNENVSPSGSSSGAAIALAISFCCAALGTETAGSIII